MDKRAKKVVYYFVGIVWGVLLSFVLHAWIEMYYINSLFSQNIIPEPSTTTHLCYLPSYLQVILLLSGIIGGYFFARWGWNKVYEKK